jgi:hypothetical protein
MHKSIFIFHIVGKLQIIIIIIINCLEALEWIDLKLCIYYNFFYLLNKILQ